MALPFVERFSLKLVQGKDLIKGRTYYLTNMFWPDGGKPVQVERWILAREQWPGERGMAAIVKDGDGKGYLVHPRRDELWSSVQSRRPASKRENSVKH
jgi:hypothetical protein